MPQREGGITDAGFSVVEYERWMERAGPGDPRRDRRLQPRRLRLQPAAPRLARGAPRRGRSRRIPSGTRTARSRARAGRTARPRRRSRAPGSRRARARTRCARACPMDRLERTPEQQGRWLLAGTPRLAPARGEAAVVGPLPARWRRRSTTSSSTDRALGGLRFVDDVGADRSKSVLHRYRFDPAQDSKVVEGKGTIALGTERRRLGLGRGRGAASIRSPGTVDSLKRNARRPHPRRADPDRSRSGTEPMRGRSAAARRPRHRARARRAGPYPRGARPDPAPPAADRGREPGRPLLVPDERRHDAVARGLGAARSTRRCLADPGPARDRQDLHRARG